MTFRFSMPLFVVVFLGLLDGRFAAPSYCQERIPTDGPCKNSNDSLFFKVKGKWIKTGDVMIGDISLPHRQEAVKRVDEFHKMIAEIYPSPTGVDAAWGRQKGTGRFAEEINHVSIPVVGYYYNAGFFRYHCDPYGKNEIVAGYPGETGTWIQVSANCNFPWGSNTCENWAIDRRPVRSRHPLKQMWKGYQMFHGDGGNVRYVLIHRKGILPYIPVTRKQYLDHSIKHLAEIFDTMIHTIRQMPVRPLPEQEAEKQRTLEKYARTYGNDPKRLKSATDYYLSGYQTDQQRRDQQVNKAVQNRNEIVKRYQDELEKTTKEGWLDSPAVIAQVHSPDMTTPFFVTDAENGRMLITENPAYMRKELPKHVPQILVLYWSWSDWEPQKNISKIVEESFPIEKLQAMIDR